MKKHQNEYSQNERWGSGFKMTTVLILVVCANHGFQKSSTTMHDIVCIAAQI